MASALEKLKALPKVSALDKLKALPNNNASGGMGALRANDVIAPPSGMGGLRTFDTRLPPESPDFVPGGELVSGGPNIEKAIKEGMYNSLLSKLNAKAVEAVTKRPIDWTPQTEDIMQYQPQGAEKAASMAGGMVQDLPLFLTGQGLIGNPITKAAVTKGVPQLAARTIGAGATGAAMGGVEAAVEGQPLPEALSTIGETAATWGGMELGLGTLGAAAKAFSKTSIPKIENLGASKVAAEGEAARAIDRLKSLPKKSVDQIPEVQASLKPKPDIVGKAYKDVEDVLVAKLGGDGSLRGQEVSAHEIAVKLAKNEGISLPKAKVAIADYIVNLAKEGKLKENGITAGSTGQIAKNKGEYVPLSEEAKKILGLESIGTLKIKPVTLPEGISPMKFTVPEKQSVVPGTEKRVRSGIVTAMESPATSSETKAGLLLETYATEKEAGAGLYDRISHKESLDKAESFLKDEGLEQSVNYVMHSPDASSYKVALGLKAVEQLEAKGQSEKATDLLLSLAEQGTRSGQMSEAFKLFYETPQGAPLKGAKIVRDALDNLSGKAKTRLKQAIDNVKVEINKINKEVVDQVIEQIPQLKQGIAGKPKVKGETKPPKEKKTPDPAEMLAQKVKQYVSEPVEKPEFEQAKQIVKTLFGKAKEVLAKEVKEVAKPSELVQVAEALKKSAEYRKVWEGAKSVLLKKYGKIPQVMQDVEVFIEHWLNVPYAERSVEKILREAIKKKGFDLEKSAFGPLSPTFEGGQEVARDLIRSIIKDSGLSGQSADTLAMELGAKFEEMAKGKRDVKIVQLADRIVKMATGTPGQAEANPIKEMFSTLIQKAKESMPKTGGKKQTKDQMITIFNALNNRHSFNQIWTATKREIIKNLEKKGISVEGANLDQLFAELLYHPYTNVQLNKAVRQGIKSYGIDLGQLVREHFTKQESTVQSLVEKLVTRGGLTKDEAAILSQDITKRMQELTTAKKEQILTQMFKERPTPQRKAIDQKIVELSNLGALDDTKYLHLIAERMGFPHFNAKTASGLKGIAEKLQTTTGLEREEWGWRLQAALATLKNASLGKKISTAQMIAQLFNSKTIIRNIVGNEIFNQLKKISKIPSTGIDWAVSKVTGTPRTITFATGGKGKGYMGNLKKGWKASIMGAQPGGIGNQYDIVGMAFNPKGNKFEQSMSLLERITGAALKATDFAAYMRTYNSALGEQAVLRTMNHGGTFEENYKLIAGNLNDIAHSIAKKEAEKATYQDVNMLTKAFIGIKSALNVNKEFGLGDIVMKYARTSANLIARSLEYSPLGIVKAGLTAARPWITSSTEPTRREVIQALTDAAVGTFGLTGFGMWLADMGIITGRPPKDRDLRTIQEEIGGGPYRLNLSMFRRLVFSGFDKRVTSPRQGDMIINYDWAQPLAMSVSLGANIMENLKEKQKWNQGLGSTVVGSLEGAINTIAEQPIFRGISRLFGGYDPATALTQTIKEVPASFTPSMLNQFRQLSDNQKRITYDPSPIKETMNKVVAKLPILNQMLPIAYTVFGQPKETYLQKGNNLFNVFLNPSFISRYNITPEAKLAIETFKQTGETKQLPRVTPKHITVSGQKFELTPLEYSEFQRIVGEKTLKGFKQISKRAKPEAQVKLMVKVLDKAGREGKVEILKKRGQRVLKSGAGLRLPKSEQKR